MSFLRPVPCLLLVTLASALLLLPGCGRRQSVRVGSKAFAESVILGDMVYHLAGHAGAPVEHARELGDTSKTWLGLQNGDLDVYVEYTGTLTREILADEDIRDRKGLERALARRGLKMSKSLGFSNNYALGMTETKARELNIATISDLRDHPDLRPGLSNAFLERADGWKGLKREYRLPFAPRGMEHGVAYRGLVAGKLDFVDLYTTDAEIKRYRLRVLQDDRQFFPAYEAVLLYRADLETRHPAVVREILRLEGAISAETMRSLNDRAVSDRIPEDEVAAAFLNDRFDLGIEVRRESMAQRLWLRTREHLLLVSISLLLAILVAVPLGVLSAHQPVAGQVILATIGLLQTIPGLALLSLLLVIFGIGAVPAIVALFIYSLLPITRNTHTGLQDIPLSVRESALALGLPIWARLHLIELPIASRNILAGIKTAAVINVGFATLGGFIGAGGYGQTIQSGLNKSNTALILEGAIPAMVLALIVQGLFEIVERVLVPRGLRLRPME